MILPSRKLAAIAAAFALAIAAGEFLLVLAAPVATAAPATPMLPKPRPVEKAPASVEAMPAPRPAADATATGTATSDAKPGDVAEAKATPASASEDSTAENAAPENAAPEETAAADTASVGADENPAQETDGDASASVEPETTTGSIGTGETLSAETEKPAPSQENAAEKTGSQELAFLAPRPRPIPMGVAAERLNRMKNDRPPYGFSQADLLKRGLDLVTADAYTSALAFSETLPNAFDRELIRFFVARAPFSGLAPATIEEVARDHPDWPDPDLLRLRAEQALLRTHPTGEALLAFYAEGAPMTDDGWLRLADIYSERGWHKRSRKIVRRIWREESLSSTQMAHILAEHADALSKEDHLYRFRRLLLHKRTGEAIRVGQAIGPGYDQLARAVAAAVDRGGSTASLMAIKTRFRGEPAWEYARILMLIRKDQLVEAALRMSLVERDGTRLGDADRWWELRKDLARMLLEEGYPALAYSVAATHAAQSPEAIVEAEFHAGWLALRYLDSPRAARAHFARIAAVATQPRSIARGYYWLGRAHAASGHADQAAKAYSVAARHGATYYGQLSREALGLTHTGLELRPRPTALDRLRFAARPEVHAIKRLAAAQHNFRTRAFFMALGDKVESPGELSLLDTLSRRINEPHYGMLAAARADARGVEVGALRAPLIVVPPDIPQPAIVDRALLYAVSKQESAFNPSATSHVGARGLMQFMPATARSTARQIGLPFSLVRLSSDPAYNATLGAAHLGELLTNLRGSYIMTFAGYNAGPGRAIDWVKRYGDPRGAETDPVDWVERIPFDETRNYVQKVMENLQAYRSRLGHTLSISKDLAHGDPVR
ncbi:transglycosylase SLT domain-containing protein [Afifella sp. H1R]|uniref:lytic transglycosylase domain-containing protein n=1 Tax=Afifella sp. H1R TaxID=2908841 RepID=UPI00351DA3C8